MDPLAFAIALMVLGALLVVAGLLLRPIWRALVAPLYRRPDAQEPSPLGWRLRTAILVVGGIATIVGGALLASDLAGRTAEVEPAASVATSAGEAPDACASIVEAVARPASLDLADAAIAEAAADAGYEVDRESSETEETLPQPSGEATVVVLQTRWTVLDGDAEVAAFTWTSDAAGGSARFDAEPCD
ncbi:hypothetical protein [Agrococcus sp. SGAir0287]|uniref:hypothetical protein n=1 Tax=Agrococcus sp. SGAir0287 TaxID=2070347 RepID=UPI0010CCF478|nr:hypothetical protein [Agrococcus sp. SGAir0287]QCR20448.1 hypothetical protein C1N71_14190 [Agrococcus sp. SGAir0287]